MDGLEFTPNKEYLEIIQNSEFRKSQLNLEGLTYTQLLKKGLFKEHGYELHHIEPRYRLKNHPTKYLNRPENIAILTIREHLLAHLYLAQFETGKFKYSAHMAFIQLWAVRYNSSYILSLSEDEKTLLLDRVEESRKNYFGSEMHKAGSSKAGKIAGAMRKEAFENSPEFREYILSKLQLSDEERVKMQADKKERKDKSPPWLLNKIKNTENKNYKYSPQFWELFDSVYEGLYKYGLSYKAIAKVLGIDYRRISNIVKIMKKKSEDFPSDFEDYIFYKEFGELYSYTYLDNRCAFEKYIAEKEVKGVYQHSITKKWVAQITINKKTIYLGIYDSFEEALKSRKKAESEYCH